MFKSLQLYRLPSPYALTAAQLIEAITPQKFTPCTASESTRQGWVSPRPDGELVHVVNRQMLMVLRTEKKVLPGAVIKAEVEVRAAKFEEKEGFAPGKKARREMKEIVTDELVAKAFSSHSNMFVWIDPVNGWLGIDTPSPSKADEAVKLLLKAVDRMPLESLRVQRSPMAVMTEWLQDGDAPAGFTVDQDATMRASGESKATVSYKCHTIELDDVRRHIAAGKKCVKLAMTWDDKISFVLTESLSIKSIKPLAVMKESDVSPRDQDERFDGDMTLTTAELSKMLSDLVAALGGPAMDGSGTSQVQMAEGGGVLEVVRALRQNAGESGTTPIIGDKTGMYDQAVAVVLEHQRASLSLIQRHLRVGYNHAASLMEEMEKKGVVSAMTPDGARTVCAPYSTSNKKAA